MELIANARKAIEQHARGRGVEDSGIYGYGARCDEKQRLAAGEKSSKKSGSTFPRIGSKSVVAVIRLTRFIFQGPIAIDYAYESI